jgi:hypothetical protein
MGGGIMPMGGATPPPVDELPPWSEREIGLPGFLNTLGQNFDAGRLAEKERMESGYRFLAGIPSTPQPTGPSQADLIQASQDARPSRFNDYSATGGVGPGASQALPSRADVAAEIAAMYGVGQGGGGAARPDFSEYRAALTDQAGQLNAQIQAMYNALGEEAGANVGRIQDIYGGASTGIGDVYGSAIGNVGDAYGSAQQQAADQLARLGIEAAAPAVINPMALSQAEAISQLEQGQAGGRAATERFGSAASGFGSQMAQVAQQQGTEMNAAILASLQNRLADSLAAEQTGGGGGGGGRGMSVSDQLRLAQYADEVYNRDVLGQVPLEEREFALRQAQALADPVMSRTQSNRDLFLELTLPQNGQRPLMTDIEAEDYIRALESRGY